VQPRRPTENERAILQGAAEAEYALLRESAAGNAATMPLAERAAYLARLEAAIEESQAWFAAGCPAHKSLGIHDYPGGGNEARLVDFGQSVAHWFGRG
jgi:hypothetical protein